MSTNRIQKSFIELRFKRHIIIPKQNSEIRFNEPVFKSIFTTKKKTKKQKIITFQATLPTVSPTISHCHDENAPKEWLAVWWLALMTTLATALPTMCATYDLCE